MTLRLILVATDLSERSDRAVSRACLLAPLGQAALDATQGKAFAQRTALLAQLPVSLGYQRHFPQDILHNQLVNPIRHLTSRSQPPSQEKGIVLL